MPSTDRMGSCESSSSTNWNRPSHKFGFLGVAIEFVEEDDSQLANAIRAGHVVRVRYAVPDRIPTEIRSAAAEALQYLADAPVLAHGRVELLWYVARAEHFPRLSSLWQFGHSVGELRDEPE